MMFLEFYSIPFFAVPDQMCKTNKSKQTHASLVSLLSIDSLFLEYCSPNKSALKKVEIFILFDKEVLLF